MNPGVPGRLKIGEQGSIRPPKIPFVQSNRKQKSTEPMTA